MLVIFPSRTQSVGMLDILMSVTFFSLIHILLICYRSVLVISINGSAVGSEHCRGDGEDWSSLIFINNSRSFQDFLCFSLIEMLAELFVTVIKVIFYGFRHKSAWISRITGLAYSLWPLGLFEGFSVSGDEETQKKEHVPLRKKLSATREECKQELELLAQKMISKTMAWS